jgi:hypothetical protein
VGFFITKGAKTMEELQKVKADKVTLMIHGKEREIKFGFSAWAKLEEEYSGLKNLDKMQAQIEERPFTYIPHLLYIGLLDKEGVTEENILDEYGLADIEKITDVFNRAIYGSLPVGDESKKAEMEAENSLGLTS